MKVGNKDRAKCDVKKLFRQRRYEEVVAILTDKMYRSGETFKDLFNRSRCYQFMNEYKMALGDAQTAFYMADEHFSFQGAPLKYFHRLGECQLNCAMVVEAKTTVTKSELRAAQDMFSDVNWVTRLNDLFVRIKRVRKKMIHADPLSVGPHRISSINTYGTLSTRSPSPPVGGFKNNADDMTVSTNLTREHPRKLKGKASPVLNGKGTVKKMSTPFSPPVNRLSLERLPGMIASNNSPSGSFDGGGYSSDESIRSEVDSVVSRASLQSEYSFKSGWTKTLSKTTRRGDRRPQRELDAMSTYINDRTTYQGVHYPVYRKKSVGGLKLKNHDSISQLVGHVDVIADEDEEMRRCRALFAMVGKGN
jgi:hypothetical protein